MIRGPAGPVKNRAVKKGPVKLVPEPQSLQTLDASWRSSGPVRVVWCDAAGKPAWRRLAAELPPDAVRVEGGSDADVVFELEADVGPGSESYRLRVDASGVRVTAASGAGLAHGASTLTQWIRSRGSRDAIPGAEISGVEITDRPAVAIRGFQLDVSRNRIPTMPELKRLVERLASLKFNQLQLYFEHAFAYAGHETVWQDFDPLTPDEIRTLASWCGERHIELVPNQNSFGHLHRWLVHEPYRQLAECPDGFVHPFSPDPEPFSLCPVDPGSVDFLRDLYAQLLPCFPSGDDFNVGLDETLDLGHGRSKGACERLGTTRVYLDFLSRVRGLAAEHGRRILFWGDVLLEQPGLLPEVPADAVALAWGYEADHPWDDTCRQLAQAKERAGLEFWVCPGTSSWNSFSGRTVNALRNTARAASALGEHGGDGYLLCDWGDHGHLQPPVVSLPGLVAGADAAWSGGRERTVDELAEFLDIHLLDLQRNESRGRTLVDLGDVHRLTGAESQNGSALFFQLLFADRPFAERRAEGMTPEGLVRAREAIAGLRPSGGDLGSRELAWSADMLDLGADWAEVRFAVGVDVPLGEMPKPELRRLRGRLEELLEELGPLWTARSRRGGLEASRARWRRVLVSA